MRIYSLFSTSATSKARNVRLNGYNKRDDVCPLAPVRVNATVADISIDLVITRRINPFWRSYPLKINYQRHRINLGQCHDPQYSIILNINVVYHKKINLNFKLQERKMKETEHASNKKYVRNGKCKERKMFFFF